MKKAIAVSIAAWVAHVSSASAAPAWCKDAQADDRYDLGDLSSKDPERVVKTLVKATCKPNPEAQANAAQIEAARQAWGKRLVMSDADWVDAVAFTNDSSIDRPDLSTKDPAAMTALDQYKVIQYGIPNSNAMSGGYDNPDYLTDMFEPNLTEAGRFAFIERCIDYSAVTYMPAVVYAQCQADIDALDKAKFGTQLRADTAHPGKYKMWLRFRLYGLPARLKKHAENVAKVHATDAAYKKLWDAAARGRAAFASTIGADKELLALATRLDGALMFQSRKLYDGCEAPTEAALAKAIGTKVSASLFKDAGRDMPKAKDDWGSKQDYTSVGTRVAPLLSDVRELMFAAGPYIQCHTKAGASAGFLGGLHDFSVGFRGPRRAALDAMTHEKVVLDDMSATITYPKTSVPFRGGKIDTAGGVVKSVKEDGDLLLVSLEKLMVKREECVQSHYTKKIVRINSDGSISYELICDKYGTVTYDDTPADFRIDKRFKPLLEKGVQFSAAGSDVLAIWPSKDAKAPSYVLGTEVK